MKIDKIKIDKIRTRKKYMEKIKTNKGKYRKTHLFYFKKKKKRKKKIESRKIK